MAWRRASLNSDGCAEVKSGLGSRWRGEKGMQDEGRGSGATAPPLKLKLKKKKRENDTNIEQKGKKNLSKRRKSTFL